MRPARTPVSAAATGPADTTMPTAAVARPSGCAINVVSEPLRPVPDTRVVAWIDAQQLETLFLFAITAAEPRAGVALLPQGNAGRACRNAWRRGCCPCLPAACFASISAALKLMQR